METQEAAPAPVLADDPASEELQRDIQSAEQFFASARENTEILFERLRDQFASVDAIYQCAAIIAALALAWLLSRPFRTRGPSLQAGRPAASEEGRRFRSTANALLAPVIAVVLLWLAVPAFAAAGLPVTLMRITASLLNAWIVIRFITSFVRDPFWSRTFAVLAWTAAALNSLRLLGPTIDFLDSLRLPGRAAGVSAFDILWAVLLGVLLLWAAAALSRFFKARLAQSEKLTPSVRGLVGQLIQIALFVGAAWLAFSAARVNLTGLAVLTGAIGVGIGFGLQSIFQNFVAGIIILLEKTLKVGDFVDLESGITGEVKEINVRSTLVTTNDNVDILVPNAEFITNRVTNWTLREVHRRVRIPFGVAYGSDKELVKKAALEAAENVPYTLKGNPKREPQVWLMEFGDSSLNFELVVWLTDEAVRRPSAVTAAYNWELETALAKYGVVIPFPQRDLHLVSPAKLTVALEEAPAKL